MKRAEVHLRLPFGPERALGPACLYANRPWLLGTTTEDREAVTCRDCRVTVGMGAVSAT